jgi:hypothetical protein
MTPKKADSFVHNEIFIKAPANVIWSNLVKAKDWPKMVFGCWGATEHNAELGTVPNLESIVMPSRGGERACGAGFSRESLGIIRASERGQESQQLVIGPKPFGFLTGGRHFFERLLFERQIRFDIAVRGLILSWPSRKAMMVISTPA